MINMTIPVGYAQIRLIFAPDTAVPEGAETTFGVQTSLTDPIDVISLVDLALFDDNEFNKCWATNVVMTSIACKLGPDATGPSAESTDSRVGTMTGTAGAAAPALLLRKGTTAGGRKSRGRMFIPGISESQTDPGGVVLAGAVTAAQTECSAVLASLITRDIPMVLLHSDSTLPNAVSSLTVQSTVATQRRRQRR